VKSVTQRLTTAHRAAVFTEPGEKKIRNVGEKGERKPKSNLFSGGSACGEPKEGGPVWNWRCCTGKTTLASLAKLRL